MTAKSNTAKSKNCIYVVSGKEQALVENKCKEIIREILGDDEQAMALSSADGDTLTAADVLDDLRTLPFLAETKVFWVRKADKFISKYRDILEKYFEQPCSSGVLLLGVETWQANTKLAKKLDKVGELIKLTQPKGRELYDSLISYAADKHGKKLAYQSAQMLVEFSGDSMATMQNEIDKLALYVDKAPAITNNDIELLCGRNRLFSAFGVIDEMTAGRVASAVQRLRAMFAEDKSSEYTAVGAFAFHFRRMFKAKVLKDQGRNDFEVARTLNIWGDQKAFFASLSRLTLFTIGNYLAELAEIDYRIKTGQTKPPTAIENFVMSFAASK